MSSCAIVILNWNGKHHLQTFLPSVVKHSTYDVIVIDNASTDESLLFLETNFESIEIIKNESNYGFAKGYNIGLEKIKGKYETYILLNSDVEVTPNWDVNLTANLSDTNVAAQPEVLSYKEPDNYEYAGASGGFIDKYGYPFCRGRIFLDIESKNEQYQTPIQIFWATGASLAIRAEVFHSLNGFDTDYFAHMEEIDLCWRIKNLGYSIIYEPSSTIYHLGGGSLAYESPFKTYLNFRNNLYLLTKNHFQSPLLPLILKRLTLDGLSGVRFLMVGQFKNCFSIIKAHFGYYKNLNRLLSKRKPLKINSKQKNLTGFYNRSVVWDYFAKGRKKYSDLDQEAFYR